MKIQCGQLKVYKPMLCSIWPLSRRADRHAVQSISPSVTFLVFAITLQPKETTFRILFPDPCRQDLGHIWRFNLKWSHLCLSSQPNQYGWYLTQMFTLIRLHGAYNTHAHSLKVTVTEVTCDYLVSYIRSPQPSKAFCWACLYTLFIRWHIMLLGPYL